MTPMSASPFLRAIAKVMSDKYNLSHDPRLRMNSSHGSNESTRLFLCIKLLPMCIVHTSWLTTLSPGFKKKNKKTILFKSSYITWLWLMSPLRMYAIYMKVQIDRNIYRLFFHTVSRYFQCTIYARACATRLYEYTHLAKKNRGERVRSNSAKKGRSARIPPKGFVSTPKRPDSKWPAKAFVNLKPTAATEQWMTVYVDFTCGSSLKIIKKQRNSRSEHVNRDVKGWLRCNAATRTAHVWQIRSQETPAVPKKLPNWQMNKIHHCASTTGKTLQALATKTKQKTAGTLQTTNPSTRQALSDAKLRSSIAFFYRRFLFRAHPAWPQQGRAQT